MELEEISSLQLEFQWLLNEEVNVILEQLKQLIVECSRRFTHDVEGYPSLIKAEKFALVSTNASHADKLKIFATVMADDIIAADINIRLPKHTASSLRFFIQNDCQWKLHQMQDAANHLAAALSLLSSSPPPLRYIESENKFDFHSAEEVIQMINSIMSYLHKGRNSLIVPKTKTIDELRNSRNMKSFQPSIPNDLAISFYIQSHKLVCAIYHQLKDAHGNLKLDMYQAETSIPWLSEVLVLFTVALQFCQQLKDKVSVFAQYKEMQIKAIP